MPRSHRTEAGSVLYIILLAVVLFAALSYAVTQSTRGGGIDPGKEKDELLVSEIFNYVTALQAAITRLQVTNGCEDTQISFENPVTSGYTNPNAPADKSCHVFDPDGAGLYYKDLLKDKRINAQHLNGGNFVQNIGKTCTDVTCKEVILLLTFIDEQASSKPLCMAINKRADVQNPNNHPPIDTNIWSGHKFAGEFGVGNFGIADNNEAPELHGKHMGCLQETTGGGNDYRFYAVLIAR